MAATGQLGGGGCPAYDILVEDLPFDFLQPRMERQVTQAGYGGPFVIRSNPIGAIFDAIRAFCFPAAMQASSDGSQYTDLSGYGTDTYGGYTQSDLGSLGYTGFYPSTGTTTPTVPVMDGGGVSPTTPTTGTTDGGPVHYMCDDPNYLAMIDQEEGAFFGMRDVLSLCTISQPKIQACIAASSVPKIKAQWVILGTRVAGHLAILGCPDCGTCKKNMPAMMPPMTPTMTGGTTPANPAGGTQSNPMMGNAGGGTGPFGYITAANPGGGSNPNPAPNTGTVTNPPPTTPPTTTITSAASAAQAGFAYLPDMPNPMSLTEGNIYMMPSAEVMGGSFDPARIGGFGTVPISPVSRARRALGRSR